MALVTSNINALFDIFSFFSSALWTNTSTISVSYCGLPFMAYTAFPPHLLCTTRFYIPRHYALILFVIPFFCQRWIKRLQIILSPNCISTRTGWTSMPFVSAVYTISFSLAQAKIRRNVLCLSISNKHSHIFSTIITSGTDSLQIFHN